jgi:hypothetical protein
MRGLFPFALSHDDGAGGERGRHGGRDHHPETEIVGIQHGGSFRDVVVLLVGIGSVATAIITTVVTTISLAGSGRTRRVVTAAIAVSVGVIAITFAFTGMRYSLAVSTRVSQDALGAAAFIMTRTRSDCT